MKLSFYIFLQTGPPNLLYNGYSEYIPAEENLWGVAVKPTPTQQYSAYFKQKRRAISLPLCGLACRVSGR